MQVHRVVPRKIRQRLRRELLEPRVIRVAPAYRARVEAGRASPDPPGGAGDSALKACLCAGDLAGLAEFATTPVPGPGARPVLALAIRGQPVVVNKVVIGSRLVAQNEREICCGGLAVVQRADQRLDDRDRPVVSADIAPGFEVMRFRDDPVAALGGLVFRRSGERAGRSFHSGGQIERVGLL